MPHLLSPWVLICSQNRTSGCLTEDEGQLYGVLLILLCFFRSRHLKSSKHLWRKRSLSSSQSPRFITLEMENNSFLTQDYITLMSSLNCLSQSSTSRFTCTAAVKWGSRQTVRPINCISLCLSLRHRTEDPHCRDFFLQQQTTSPVGFFDPRLCNSPCWCVLGGKTLHPGAFLQAVPPVCER